jgi:hypothetical protein
VVFKFEFEIFSIITTASITSATNLNQIKNWSINLIFVSNLSNYYKFDFTAIEYIINYFNI